MIQPSVKAGEGDHRDRRIGLSASPELVASGLLNHLLPRFSLKTGIRVNVIDGDADITLGLTGTQAALSDLERIYFITARDKLAKRFVDWLLSDIGQNTVAAFPPFVGVVAAKDERPGVTAFTGDIARGEILSLKHCGRCHVINQKNRHNDIGSTPSFASLRNFPNWGERFRAFYTLNPHPSFTQITNVTRGFAPSHPPPIVPVEITPEELESILAFVSTISPAYLGPPLRGQ